MPCNTVRMREVPSHSKHKGLDCFQAELGPADVPAEQHTTALALSISHTHLVMWVLLSGPTAVGILSQGSRVLILSALHQIWKPRGNLPFS